MKYLKFFLIFAFMFSFNNHTYGMKNNFNNHTHRMKNNNEALIEACKKEEPSYNVIKNLIENGAYVNLRDQEGNTPLHLICIDKKDNYFDIVQYLIEQKGNPNIKSKAGNTPLHLACSHGNDSFNIVKYLLEQGANRIITNKNGKIPYKMIPDCFDSMALFELFDHSVSHDNDEKFNQINLQEPDQDDESNNNSEISSHELIEQNLIENFEDQLTFYNKTIPTEKLLEECKTSYPSSYHIKKYIENQADLTIQDESNNTLLHILCDKKQLNWEIITFLIEHNADMNSKNKLDQCTPLHMLCYKNLPSLTPDIIKLLIKGKADIHALDKNGNDFLLLSIDLSESICSDSIKLLIEHKAHVNTKNTQGDTPLHILAYKGQIQDFNVMELLVENKADLNIKNNYTPTTPYRQVTPLYLMLYYEASLSCSTIKFLIEHKGDMNIKHEGGMNEEHSFDASIPLHMLYHKYQRFLTFEVIKLLLEKKADINIRDKDGNDFLLLLMYGKTNNDNIKLLITHQADVNTKNNSDCTPLLIASIMKNPSYETIKLLIKHKADVNAARNCITPLIALCGNDTPSMLNKNLEIIKLLLDKKAQLNSKEPHDITPLNRVCNNREPSLDMIKLLLEYKADLNVVTKSVEGIFRPLELLCLRDQSDKKIKFLIDQHVSDKKIKFLIDQHVDVIAIDEFGNTALHRICKKKELSASEAKFLVFYLLHSIPYTPSPLVSPDTQNNYHFFINNCASPKFENIIYTYLCCLKVLQKSSLKKSILKKDINSKIFKYFIVKTLLNEFENLIFITNKEQKTVLMIAQEQESESLEHENIVLFLEGLEKALYEGWDPLFDFLEQQFKSFDFWKSQFHYNTK